MTAEELLSALAKDPMERLRWLLCRRFGLSPEAAPGDAACLWAAANLVLDARLGAAGGNAAFDEARFAALKEAGA